LQEAEEDTPQCALCSEGMYSRVVGPGPCNVCLGGVEWRASRTQCIPRCPAGSGRSTVVVERNHLTGSDSFVFLNRDDLFTEGGVLDVDVVRGDDAVSAPLNKAGRFVTVWPINDGSGLWHGRVHPSDEAEVGDWYVNDHLSLWNDTGCTPCPVGTYHDEDDHLEGCKLCPTSSVLGATVCDDSTSCPVGLIRNEWQRVCSCNNSYMELVAGACRACELNKEVVLTSTGYVCVGCPEGSMTKFMGLPCTCVPGKGRNATGACVLCELGWYSNELSDLCEQCPGRQTSLSDHTGCICDAVAGFVSTPAEITGTPNYYIEPLGVNGRWTLVQHRDPCSCVAGFFTETQYLEGYKGFNSNHWAGTHVVDRGGCQQCIGDTYAAATHPMDMCEPCPLGSYPTADHDACVCGAGTYFSGLLSAFDLISDPDMGLVYRLDSFVGGMKTLVCLPCGSGTYKPDVGNSQVCLPCAPGSVPWRGDLPCREGMVCLMSGDPSYSRCEQCTGASVAAPNGAKCIECGVNEDASENLCVCIPDTHRVDGLCVPCPAGTGKVLKGDGVCISLECGMIENSVPVSDEQDFTWTNEIIEYHNHGLGSPPTWWPEVRRWVYVPTSSGEYERILNPAGEFHSDVLVQGPFVGNKCGCALGLTLDLSGNESLCSMCVTGSFLTNAGACEQCPIGRTTTTIATSQRDCTCPHGTSSSLYETTMGVETIGVDDACILCPFDMFKITGDSSMCQTCPQLERGTANRTMCVGFSGTVATMAFDQYINENPGFTSPRSWCPAGTFYESGSQECRACPSGLYQPSVNMDPVCMTCPPNSRATRGGTTCECTRYFFEGLAVDHSQVMETEFCVPCPLYSNGMREEYGGMLGDLSNAIMCICPMYAVSVAEISTDLNADRCQCGLGAWYSSVDKACLQCAPGTVKTTTSNADQCLPCASTPAGCGVCSSDAFHTIGDGCTSCGINTVFDISSGLCTCLPGFLVVNTDTTLTPFTPIVGGCMACAVGSVWSVETHQCVSCDEFSYTTGYGAESCSDCPLYAIATPNRMSCSCSPARYLDTEDNRCVSCAPGDFKDSVGNDKCVPCAPGNVSLEGQTVCTSCVNFTISTDDRTSCIPCPGNESYVNATVCVCSPGYFRGLSTGRGVCEPCHDKTVKFAIGDEGCLPCPDRSQFFQSETQTGCICDAGAFLNQATSECLLCVPGTFKNVSGDQTCTACPVGMNTLSVGTIDVGECVCDTGFFRNNAFKCQACPVNTFNPVKAALGSEGCLPCPYRMFQPATGQANCAPMSVELGHTTGLRSHVVGLFVHGNTSCVYITSTSSSSTDKVCWGELTETNPILTSGVFPAVPESCGDGVLHPSLEQCDDGNPFSGDGCSSQCIIESGFFCEPRSQMEDIRETLWIPSKCCRITDAPPSHAPTCVSCNGRVPPYPGVRFSHDCRLVDVDECGEGIDACVLETEGGICVNIDAVVNGGVALFECACAPGTFLSDGKCSSERFAIRLVLNIDQVEYPDTKHQVQLITTREAKTVIGDVGLSEVHVEEEGGLMVCTIFVDSLGIMYDLTTHFNTTRLLQGLVHVDSMVFK
jgi:cysteine-rich repeat protein